MREAGADDGTDRERTADVVGDAGERLHVVAVRGAVRSIRGGRRCEAELEVELRGCVNAGLALRFIEDVDYASEEEELMAQALPGRIVRRGTWTWEPLFLDWDELTPTHQAYETLHPIVAQMTSGLSPRYACSNHFAMHVL